MLENDLLHLSANPMPKSQNLFAPHVFARLRNVFESRVGLIVLVEEVFYGHATNERRIEVGNVLTIFGFGEHYGFSLMLLWK